MMNLSNIDTYVTDLKANEIAKLKAEIALKNEMLEKQKETIKVLQSLVLKYQYGK